MTQTTTQNDTGQWTPYGSIQPDRRAPRRASSGRQLDSCYGFRYQTFGKLFANLFQSRGGAPSKGVGILGLTAPHQILHFHIQRNCDPLQNP